MATTVISIHAAREGGDGTFFRYIHIGIISIHAAREGGDPLLCDSNKARSHFNPRRP